MTHLLALLVAITCLGLQVFIGGAKMLYSIPAYGIAAAAGLLTLWPSARPRVQPQAWCVVTALLLGVYIAVRAALSPVEYLARPDFYMVLACLVVYWVTAFHVTEPRLRMGIIMALLVFAIGHVIVGAVQFREGNNFMPLPWIYRFQYGNRASGFYICPNHLAGMLEVLGLFGLGFVCWARWRPTAKILAGYLALVCYVGVAITGSRGGYLSTTFSVFVFMALAMIALGVVVPERFWKYAPLVILSGILLLGVGLLLMLKSDFLRWRVQLISETNNIRWLLWEAGMKQFWLNPVWGTGAGTYLYYGRQFRSAMVQNDPVYVHNDYIHLLAEYGIVGAVLMLLFLVAHVAAGLRSLRWLLVHRLRDMRELGSNTLALQIPALACVAAYLVHSVVDFNLHIPANAVFMAMVFGMLANPGVRSRDPARAGSRLASLLRWVAPAGGVAIALLAIPKWPGEYFTELARVYLRDSMWPEAIQAGEGGLAVEKKNPNLYYHLGETQRIWGFSSVRLEEKLRLTNAAIRTFQAGLAVFPDDLNLLIRLGMAYDTLRQFDAARACYEKAMRDDPNFGNVYAFFGLHWQVQGKFDEAEALYRQSLRFGDNAIAKAGLADIRRFREELKKRREQIMPEVLEVFEGDTQNQE